MPWRDPGYEIFHKKKRKNDHSFRLELLRAYGKNCRICICRESHGHRDNLQLFHSPTNPSETAGTSIDDSFCFRISFVENCFLVLICSYHRNFSNSYYGNMHNDFQKSLLVVAHASICCHCTCKANRRVIIQLHSSPRNRFTTLCSPLNQNSGILLKSPTVSLLKATRKILAVSSLIRIKTYRIYTGRLGWCKCFCCPSTLFTHYAGTLLFSFFLLIPSR